MLHTVLANGELYFHAGAVHLTVPMTLLSPDNVVPVLSEEVGPLLGVFTEEVNEGQKWRRAALAAAAAQRPVC